ncbi:MAG: hypothetical protein RLZZ136_812, partial [Pseudomonadota bacterium]
MSGVALAGLPAYCANVTSLTAPGTRRLLGLDALRGIAALCVVIMHTHVLFPDTPNLSAKAYLAVDFFFILSGYVMARTYEPRLANKGLSARQFFIARYRRLWPTMLIGGLLFIPFLADATGDTDPHWLKLVLPNLLLLPSPLSENLFPLNVPAWSIFFELIANLVHGLILRRFGWRGVGITCLLCGLGLAYAAHGAGGLDIGSGHNDLLKGLLRVGMTYCMGILLWRHWGQKQIAAPFAVLALVAMPMLFWLGAMPLFQTWLFDFTIVILACPLILLGGLALRGGGWFAKWAGELSFPLYATHYAVLYWCRKAEIGPLRAVMI